jgi:hypothetical protein
MSHWLMRNSSAVLPVLIVSSAPAQQTGACDGLVISKALINEQ